MSGADVHPTDASDATEPETRATEPETITTEPETTATEEAAMPYSIRPVGDDDFFGWLPLFDGYCRFYERELDDAKALRVWTWLRDDAHPLEGVVAVDELGAPIALAHFRPAPDTLTATTGLQLDDLYVSPDRRGHGIGRALIAHVGARAATLGGAVTWITAEDNADAQRLYDSLARRTSWVTYEMDA